MGQRNTESTAKSVQLIFKVVVIVFLVPSALSQNYQKTTNITDLFNCALDRLLLIKEANFSEQTSHKLCRKDGNSSHAQETMDVADCSKCFNPRDPQQQQQQPQKQQQKCVAPFSPLFLSEIYLAKDSPYNNVRQSVIDKANRDDGQYTIVYRCVRLRDAILNPCEKKKINGKQNYTIAIFHLSPRKPQSCKSNCTVQLHDTKEVEWESQFLLRNGASAEDNSVSYKIVVPPYSLNLTRINSPYLEKFPIKKSKEIRIRLQFRIKNVLDVSRFWLDFTGAKVSKIECTTIKDDKKKKDASASDSNESEDDDDDDGGGDDDDNDDDDHTTTETLPLESSTPDGLSGSGTSGEQHQHGHKKQYWRYLFAIPAVLAFLAVVICILSLVWKKSDNQPIRNPETSYMLQTTTPKSNRRTTNDNPQSRHGRFQNEAYSNSFDATDAAQPSRRGAFPPLVGHVTGSGSDDRQYGTLDHYGEGRRRWKEEEDDYNHVLPPGSEGDYESCQRETGRQIVIDNPYDHTS